jgi:peptidoglycan/xylan/chitin deacetylase (PgdA/CDA1 family)
MQPIGAGYHRLVWVRTTSVKDGGGMRGAEIIKGALRLLSRAIPREPGDRVVVFCYHSIHPSIPFRSATPELFSDHLAWLREHCECVPFSQVLMARQRKGDGLPIVSITFDDGYADNHEYALSLLAQHGIPATFFLTAGFLDGDGATLERFQRLRRMDREEIRPLDWGQVNEILEAGFEVGAHTYSHPNLARLPGPNVQDELGRSRRVIEDRVGRPVSMMAYPFGRPRVHFTPEVVSAVRRAGYDVAGAIVTRGVKKTDHPLSVPRVFVTNDSVEELREKVLGVWDLIGTVREKMPLALSRAASPADFRV